MHTTCSPGGTVAFILCSMQYLQLIQIQQLLYSTEEQQMNKPSVFVYMCYRLILDVCMHCISCIC